MRPQPILQNAPRMMAVRCAAIGVVLALAGCGGGGGGGGGTTYTLGGTISGLGGNTGLVLANGNATLAVAGGATSFSFSTALASGTTYAVSVQSAPSGLTCTVAGGTGTITTNVSNVVVTCSGQSYTVGGTVTINGPTGVTLSDQGLVLTNTGNGDTYTFTSNASSFTMPISVPYGSAYAIAATTQPTGLNCTVSNPSTTMPASNVTNVAVTCSDQSYTLGGTISGLGANSGLVLTNEGVDATTILANATSFTMHTPVPYGAAYSVAVASAPTAINCSVTLGTGTMPAAAVTSVVVACGAGTASVVYSFGASGDGAKPYGSLLQASDGNLYGMTEIGGAHNNGVVFKVTAAGAESVLYSFGASSSDGANPYGNLLQASDGNLYGMTTSGGANSTGVVFKITLAGVESVLHSFGGAGDGANPYGGLVQASDGNLYGLTELGGTNSYGTVIQVTLAGTESVLHSFGAAGDGMEPYGSLIQATDGNLYGLTELGGGHNYGTLIRVTVTGAESVLHSFGASGDGVEPYGSLVQASDGALYGMTVLGGANNLGTVFELN